jgi:YVTN family beta-propeller protein
MKFKVIKFTILFFSLLIIFSCSNEEIFIDNYKNDSEYVFQCDENSLNKLSMLDTSISSVDLGEINIGKIDVIKKFRNKYYLISTQQNKIFVYSNKLIFINEVDYSHLGITPIDICFPNATDGYVIHKNDSIITILDLTNNIISGIQINIDGMPEKIDGIGNQIYVTIPAKNLVDVIDTRTNKVETSISIENRPTFVEITNDGMNAVIVSTGNGKIENTPSEKTEARVTIIDVTNHSIKTNFILGNNSENSQNILPTNITSTPKNIYITATNLATSVNTSFRIASNILKSAAANPSISGNLIGYNPEYNILYFIEESNVPKIYFVNPDNNTRAGNITLPQAPWAICY